MSLTIRGDAQLIAGLDGIAAGLKDPHDPLRSTGELLERDARGRAPKRTGALARSIRATTETGSASVGTPISYGLPVHFGVPSRGMRAQPFLAQAVDAQAAAIEAVWSRDVQTLIDQEIHG